jgi:hypothetical protein
LVDEGGGTDFGSCTACSTGAERCAGCEEPSRGASLPAGAGEGCACAPPTAACAAAAFFMTSETTP